MLALLLASLVASAPATPAVAPATAFPAAVRARLDAAVSKWLASSGAPGVALGIWMPGKGTYVAARGYADLQTKRPMSTSDYFRIGSNTKTFTVTALLQLCDQHVLSLDDPVSKYFPFVPNGGNITLRMLANMTSGLFNYTEDEEFVKTLLANPHGSWAPRQLVNVAFDHPPYFKPGTGWHYSNTNTVLLGMILERVTRRPLADVFVEQIFEPLGLQHTLWPMGRQLPDPHADGITVQTPDGRQADATKWNPSWAFSAGALASTLDDMHVWIQSYATGTLVSPAMQKQRLTWVTFPPNTWQKAYGLGIGHDVGWLGHSGELPGYNTAAYYLPARKAAIVVMVNSDIAARGQNPALALVKALTKIVTPENVPI